MRDPGPCPICGAAHTTCTASTGPITIAQTPARDAATDAEIREDVNADQTPFHALGKPRHVPLEADRVQATLPAGQFTSGTYRGKDAKGKK